MSGISLTFNDPTVNTNNFHYNNKELYKDGGLDWYDYGARYYDPQVYKYGGYGTGVPFKFNPRVKANLTISRGETRFLFKENKRTE